MLERPKTRAEAKVVVIAALMANRHLSDADKLSCIRQTIAGDIEEIEKEYHEQF